MNPQIEALRNAMRAAQVSGHGQYIDDGQHELELKLFKCQQTNISGRIKESYIVEFTVVASTNATHEVGSTRSYVENPENAGWDGRLKACLLACAGVNPNGALTPADHELAADFIAAARYDEYRVAKGWPENWLARRRVFCEGIAGTSQKNKKPITHKNWAPAPDPVTP